jgi:hypothetical protein
MIIFEYKRMIIDLKIIRKEEAEKIKMKIDEDLEDHKSDKARNYIIICGINQTRIESLNEPNDIINKSVKCNNQVIEDPIEKKDIIFDKSRDRNIYVMEFINRKKMNQLKNQLLLEMKKEHIQPSTNQLIQQLKSN